MNSIFKSNYSGGVDARSNGSKHGSDELRQREVGDDYSPLHAPKTPRGQRCREQARRASFSTTSKPSAMKPTSTALSGQLGDS